MDRHITQYLLEWRNNPRRMPLIVRGPRQVGKSYLIEQFGQMYYKQLIIINFELNPLLKNCFNDLDPKHIINQLELILGLTITEDQQTLLFLDEIQECPQAILALRYFKEKKPAIPIIAAGSLLEFTLQNAQFRMPVGRVQYLYLRPLSFTEYLEARGFTQLVLYLREVTIGRGIEIGIHQKLLGLFQEYLILGGMPNIVNEFLLTQRYQPCQSLQEALLATYRDDFGKYAKHTQYRYLQALFERTPTLVGENFKFSKIDAELRARELKPALENLVMAGLVHLVYRTSASGLPLISTRDEKHYKLHFIDVGLMVQASHLSASILADANFLALNRGALMEQLVGQELLTLFSPTEIGELYYWSREKINSMAEVDYVIAVANHIIPIEVKAGKTGRLKSLQVFLQEKQLPLGIKISLEPLVLHKNILSLPAYMINELPRLVETSAC